MFYKLMKKLCLPLVVITPLSSLLISCNKTEDITKIRIDFKTPWWEFKNDERQLLKDNIQDEINNSIKNINYQNIEIEINTNNSEDNIIVSNVASGKTDIGFCSIGSINSWSNDHQILPIIQTQTNSFKWTDNWSNYQDGMINDPLFQTGQEITDEINKYPKLTDDDFNGSVYESFYNFDKKVDFYRGMILIYGTDEEIIAIKDSWKNRDWNSFREFGIITGNTSSSGSFKSQASLLKKHFKNGFTTLLEDINQNTNSYKVNGKGRDIGKDQKYHIAFDDEGSFAWTHNNDNDYFNPKDPQASIEVLTVTEPLKYDVGIASTKIPNSLIQPITNAIINIYKNGLDTLGPRLGYNGYKIINNVQKEIFDKYREVIF